MNENSNVFLSSYEWCPSTFLSQPNLCFANALVPIKHGELSREKTRGERHKELGNFVWGIVSLSLPVQKSRVTPLSC